MLRSLIAAALMLALTSAAESRPRHPAPLRGFDVQSITWTGAASPLATVARAARHKQAKPRRALAPVWLVNVETAGGPITVDASVSEPMKGFIADVVARGFRGRIHCWSPEFDARGRRTHVRGSNHYWGGACDFAQRGWGITHRVMYSVADLARKWGLRNGCVFGDCGHIDLPRSRLAKLQ